MGFDCVEVLPPSQPIRVMSSQLFKGIDCIKVLLPSQLIRVLSSQLFNGIV